MAEEIAQLKQLQASMNAAFDNLFKSAQEGAQNARAVAAAKQQLGATAQMTFGAALGPAFSIIGLTIQVSSRFDAGNLERKAHISQAPCICRRTDCDRSETIRDYQQAH
jgi:phage tail tape-measure protein